MRPRGPARIGLVAFVGIVAATTVARGQIQDVVRQKCINKLNQAVTKLVKVQRADIRNCLRFAARNRLDDGMTAEACLVADIRGKVNKAFARTVRDEAQACNEDQMPDFAFAGAATVNRFAAGQELALFADVFGPDPDAVVADAGAEPLAAECQLLVVDLYGKILDKMLRGFRGCTKRGLKSGSIVDSGDLENRCFAEVLDDRNRGIERAEAQFDFKVGTLCHGVDLAGSFPGECASAAAEDAAAFAACARQHSLCRMCILLNAANAILGPCDEFDDGSVNGTCVDPALCGNGLLEPGELCDDGNTVEGDCCSSLCEPATDGTGCDDGSYCNGTDQCQAGACALHSGDPCAAGGECADSCDENTDTCLAVSGAACSADANPCTDDVCNGAGACVHPANSAACDDGVFCNGIDSCDAGVCSVHTGNPCAANAECADSCDEGVDSCNEPAETPCTDDGNPCTDDFCDGDGGCVHIPNSAPCDDGQWCNGTDTCGGGTCSVHTGSPCAGGEECADACDEAADSCFDPVATPCSSDGNPCTDDVCNGEGDCVHQDNSAPCDDGVFCNGADTCSGGTCSVHDGNPCSAGGECADVCDEAADTCNLTAGAPCTDDGNVCTSDVCDGAGACVHPANNAPCDDGVWCNGADTCSAASCSLHTGNPCAGGTECADVCDEAGDTCNVAAGTACGSDSNPCTDDVCSGTGHCLHQPNSLPCDDGEFCNGEDTCAGGSCSIHSGDPCPGADGDADCNETCLEVTQSCIATDPNDSPCDDGDPCTGPDRCSAGSCVTTPLVGCGATIANVVVQDLSTADFKNDPPLATDNTSEWRHTVASQSTATTIDVRVAAVLGADDAATVDPDVDVSATVHYTVAFDVVPEIDWSLDLSHAVAGAFSLLDDSGTSGTDDGGARAEFLSAVSASCTVDGGSPVAFDFSASPSASEHPLCWMAFGGCPGATTDAAFSGSAATTCEGSGNASVVLEFEFGLRAFSNGNAAAPANHGDEAAVRIGLSDSVSNGFTAGEYPSGGAGLDSRDPALDGHFASVRITGVP